MLVPRDSVAVEEKPDYHASDTPVCERKIRHFLHRRLLFRYRDAAPEPLGPSLRAECLRTSVGEALFSGFYLLYCAVTIIS